MCQQTDGNCANTALQQRGGRAARPGGTGPGFRTRRGASWFPDRACTPSLFIPPPCTQREGNTPVGQLIKRGLQGLPWSQRLRLHASTAGDTGLIPGPVTKIVQAMRCGQEKKKRGPQLWAPAGLRPLVSDIRQQVGPVILNKPLSVKPFLETVYLHEITHPLGQGQSSKEKCGQLLKGCEPRTQGGRTVR